MTAASMPAEPISATPAPASLIEPFFYDVVSADGTVLKAWTNDPDCLIDGPAVVLCNGLGTNAWTMPALLKPDCGVRVISWNHRGVGGSARPSDHARVGVEEFAEDAIAVLDAAGLEHAVFMGWSIGVNTMFEVAVRHPERVDGLFAMAGVPGNTFGTMLEPLLIPAALARIVSVNVSRALQRTGRLISPITTRLPMGPLSISALSHTGFMFPVPDAALAQRALKEFVSTPVDWYFHLAVGTSSHKRVSLSGIEVPAMFVAGKWDLLAGPRAMRSAASRMKEATYVELNGSHFIGMEQPDAVHDLLLEFLASLD